jgi:2-polyprenyl-3-methyl-5-hydroxy-6-metoxy-1,4-benzoquinol methylase
MIDIGKYNADPESYRKLIEDLYAAHPPLTVPPEYAYFIQDNLLRLLIRLARYKFAARMLQKRDRVLEVGSGSGIGAFFLSQYCAHVTGLELKETELEEARGMNRRNNVEFISGDFFQMDPSLKFDAIVALDVIEHMPIEQGDELVRAMARHLASGGMAIIGTPSIYSYDYQSPQSKASHVKCYDQEELLELVRRSFSRAFAFSMNDEVLHTGYAKMAWYYFILAVLPKDDTSQPGGTQKSVS